MKSKLHVLRPTSPRAVVTAKEISKYKVEITSIQKTKVTKQDGLLVFDRWDGIVNGRLVWAWVPVGQEPDADTVWTTIINRNFYTEEASHERV